jgi:hypothetical protein
MHYTCDGDKMFSGGDILKKGFSVIIDFSLDGIEQLIVVEYAYYNRIAGDIGSVCGFVGYVDGNYGGGFRVFWFLGKADSAPNPSQYHRY